MPARTKKTKQSTGAARKGTARKGTASQRATGRKTNGPGIAKTRAGAKPATRTKSTKRALLSGGNPQIAKGDGDAPVQAYIAAVPGWKQAVARRLDALITRTVAKVRKAVKWNSPFYGTDIGMDSEGRGWFLSFHCFNKYIKVGFFNGASLKPLPPVASKHKDVRYLDIREDDKLDEKQLASWVRQAAKLPGWRT
jgi:hypothetical protein